jgi:hypothetical protein
VEKGKAVDHFSTWYNHRVYEPGDGNADSLRDGTKIATTLRAHLNSYDLTGTHLNKSLRARGRFHAGAAR